MRTARGFLIGLVVGLLLAGSTVVAQPFPPAVQLAVNQLITGVTPFNPIRLTASAYANWGTTTGSSGYGIRDNSGTLQFKNSGGSWQDFVGGAGGGAPADASYWVRTANATLSNETVMGALGTGLVINTTTTGVPSIYAGASCTNQFPQSVSASGALTCDSVVLTTDVSGTLPVANGGTGLTTGTSGGIPYFSSSSTLASSGVLTANRLVLGGGAATTPTVLAAGTTTTVLHGNAGGAPTFGAVVLTTDVSGILPAANGGTANAFFAVTGPTTTTRTFTFPNADATVLTSGTAVTPAQGGTGLTSYTTGDLIQATGATTLAALAATSTGNALISGGVGTISAWGKIGLTTHVSGTLAATNGGTGFASYTVGDLLYASSTTALARLNGVAAGSYLRSAGTSTAPVWSTTTLPNSATTGDLLSTSAANTYANIAAVALGQVLISQGTSTLPAWSSDVRMTTLRLGANVTFSSATPTLTAGFGTSPSVTAGTATAMRINVGTGGTATDGTITLGATATTGWNCWVENLTATAANRMDQRTVQISSTTTTAVIENQTISTGAALAWTASDILAVSCVAF